MCTSDIGNTPIRVHEALGMSDPCHYQKNTEHVSAKLLLPFVTVQQVDITFTLTQICYFIFLIHN